MTTVHTKGEWKHYYSEMLDTNYVRTRERVICNINDEEVKTKKDRKEAEANAKLIAAAPDLLEALKTLIDHNVVNAKGGESYYNMALNAIKKAT